MIAITSGVFTIGQPEHAFLLALLGARLVHYASPNGSDYDQIRRDTVTLSEGWTWHKKNGERLLGTITSPTHEVFQVTVQAPLGPGADFGVQYFTRSESLRTVTITVRRLVTLRDLWNRPVGDWLGTARVKWGYETPIVGLWLARGRATVTLSSGDVMEYDADHEVVL